MLSSKYFSLYILNCLFFFKSTTVYGIDPFTASATSAAFAYLLGYYGKSYDFFKCPKSSLDIEKLKLALEENFFGQHIATHIVLSALEGNLHRSKNNKKPLVMCFQGTTGSGKNYLSELIADHMFDSEKVKMKQFHVIHGRSYFVDESKIDSKREELYTYVKSKIESCDTNVFVFDEVDSIPMGALDILISIFENNEVSVDSRNSIFIFLTNAGADAIERKCLEFLENGNYRESMNIQDFDTILLQSAFNYKGALKKSEIIDSGVIDLYVPFLPLESVHVSKCIKAEVKNLKQDLDSKKIRRILKILFIPGSKNVFSSSGCKRIKQLVTLEFKPY